MSNVAAWVLVALAAVLVAAAVPVLLQLRRTLKMAEQTLDVTGRRLNEVLGEVTTTLVRVNNAADEMERGLTRVSSLFEALGGIGDALVKVRSSIGAVASLGSILGGAVLAALGLKARHRAEEAARPEPVTQEVDAR
jgi:uncharacterized protein YoxC